MNVRLTQLQTETYAAEREWTVEGLPVLTASVSVPQPVSASGSLSRRIRRFYRLQAQSYLRYCERWLLPQAKAEYQSALATSTPFSCFHAALTYQITYNDGGFWSLYTQSCETTRAGHALLTRHGDTWDLAIGYPVALSSFFPPHTRWKQQLLSVAAQEIQRQETAGISIYHADWRRALRRHLNPRSFYLTADGLVFFYPMYSIAPAIEGIPAFLLPYPHTGSLCAAQMPPPTLGEQPQSQQFASSDT